MDGQLAAVHIVCLVAEKIEKLGIALTLSAISLPILCMALSQTFEVITHELLLRRSFMRKPRNSLSRFLRLVTFDFSSDTSSFSRFHSQSLTA